jgi:hypothetical protein
VLVGATVATPSPDSSSPVAAGISAPGSSTGGASVLSDSAKNDQTLMSEKTNILESIFILFI